MKTWVPLTPTGPPVPRAGWRPCGERLPDDPAPARVARGGRVDRRDSDRRLRAAGEWSRRRARVAAARRREVTGTPWQRDWTEAALRAISDAGHRSSSARQAVVELLAGTGGGLIAWEIADRLRGQASTASVYRALGVLVDLGLLRAVDLGQGSSRYELILDDGEHHHHLVCRRCGRTNIFVDPDLEIVLQRVQDDTSYAIDGHDVVLRGLCSACAFGSGK